MELELTNIINVSVSQAPAGIGAYNTSNIALFTSEEAGGDFGDDGYKIYKSPSGVATDFGSDSKAYQSAVSVFSQKPNILAGDGYLVVINTTPEEQHFALSGTPASGQFKVNFNGGLSSFILWNDNAAAIQVKLRLMQGLEMIQVSGSLAAGLDLLLTGYTGDAPLMTISNNNLATSVPVSITITVTEATAGQTLADAITDTQDVVQYFGIITDTVMGSVDLLASAAIVETLNKILFVAQSDATTVDSGGLLDELRTGSLDQTRGLLYVGTGVALDAVLFAAAYAGRGLSTNFNGSNTTQTMHLKDLIGIQPDSGMTQTILEKCKIAGADVYASFQGVPKVFCTGGNRFFDQVYNQQWFVGAIQVAGFNALAESSTKLPQTEQGMSVLKAAYRTVAEQAVANQYVAPGTWNSPDTFGNLNDFLRNVTERGYYIYSSPIATQLKANRDAREAPLVQIAIKEAGAIQSSDVLIFINP